MLLENGPSSNNNIPCFCPFSSNLTLIVDGCTVTNNTAFSGAEGGLVIVVLQDVNGFTDPPMWNECRWCIPVDGKL